MTPLDGAFLFAGATAAGEIAIAASILAWRRSKRWHVGRDKVLLRRMRLAAAPLTGAVAGALSPGEDSIFRATSSRSGLSSFVEGVYPLLEFRKALPRALGAGLAAAAAAWLAIWILKIPAGAWTLPLAGLAGAGGIWYALGWLQARQETEFVRTFPEIVDQIVRLAGAGVPSMEALSVVTEDASKPVEPILRSVCDGLIAGLDPDVALRAATVRVRMAEFTMFAAVIRLQRRSGGGVSTAFTNLSNTLRERRQTALKAHASTAQSRLTILVLALIPVVVLLGQRLVAPASVDALFGTPQGTTLLQIGVGLIVTGILVARALVARGSR